MSKPWHDKGEDNPQLSPTHLLPFLVNVISIPAGGAYGESSVSNWRPARSADQTNYHRKTSHIHVHTFFPLGDYYGLKNKDKTDRQTCWKLTLNLIKTESTIK